MGDQDSRAESSTTSAKKSGLNKPRSIRSAAPSPSVLPPSVLASQSFGSPKARNPMILDCRAEPNAPSPSTQYQSCVPQPSSAPDVPEMLPHNIHAIHQRARSNAPSPSPSISTIATFNNKNNSNTQPTDIIADPNVNTEKTSRSLPSQFRRRSNAPSPSPSISAPGVKRENMNPNQSDPGAKHEGENERRSRAGRRMREAAPRTFRSSAPSPDRSLSMSCTPPAGIVPPANTPVEPTKSKSASTPVRDTSSGCSSRGLRGRMSGEEDGDDDEDSDEDSEQGNTRYNPENDITFHTLYRQSKTSVTNTSSVSVSKSKPYHPADPIIPDFLLSNPGTGAGDGNGNRGEDGDEDEIRGVWNPPHAPKAMQSHQITWINDKKVGERINGVQVPIESDEEDERGRGKVKGMGMGSGIKKGLGGKLKIGKKGVGKR